MGKGTHTSRFGSSGRINHDSSLFYARRLYKDNNNTQLKPSEKDLAGKQSAKRILR
jgi:hypothetical protein